MIVACMGGWCRQRERCAHHHSASRVISERLCERGFDDPEPMRPRLARTDEPQADRLPPTLRHGASETA